MVTASDDKLAGLEDAIYRGVKRINYTQMYEQLAQKKFALKADPIEFGLAPVTGMIAKLNEMISDTHQMYLEAVKNKDTWQRAYRSVSDLYSGRLAMMCTREDIKGFKTMGEREAKAKEELGREEALLKEAEKHFFTEGNSTGGESVSYLAAVNSVRELLAVTNSNLKLQLQVVQDMFTLGEVTAEELQTRNKLAKKLAGK